jgi:tetratricopeptide (TPR) repeat protein
VLSKEAAAILERMLVFYDRLAKQDGDDGRLREKVAEANRRVGDIRQRLGQYEESQMAYSHAAALYEKLCESSVIDSHFKAEIARVYNELGNVQGAMNRVKEGRDAYRQALTILEQLVADSSSPELRFELARTFYFLGKGPNGQHGPPPMMLLGGPRGPRPGSPHNPLDFGFAFGMPDFRPPELDDLEPLGPDDGGPPEPRDDGGPTPMEFIFGFPGPFQGPPDGPFGPDRDYGPPFGGENRRKMGEYLTKAVEILQRLIAEHPDVPDYRQLLARCYREVSQESFGRGSTSMPDAAKESAEILAKLVEKYPNVSDYRYDLSEAYLALATNDWRTPSKSRDEKSKLESQKLLEKALAISEDLVAENPNIPDYAVALAQLRLRLAFTLSSDEKQTEAAEQYFRKAIDSQAALVRRFPHVSNYKFGLAFAEDTFAVFLKRQKRLPEAQAALRESIDSMKEAMQSDSRAHFIRGILDRNYSILADMLRQSGDEQGAAEAERQVELLRSER